MIFLEQVPRHPETRVDVPGNVILAFGGGFVAINCGLLASHIANMTSSLIIASKQQQQQQQQQ